MTLLFYEIFIKESQWNSMYKKRKIFENPQKNRGKNSWKIGCPIFTLLPTPLVRLCPICLTPPSPPKIGHHLCTFPYCLRAWCSFKTKYNSKVKKVFRYSSLFQFISVLISRGHKQSRSRMFSSAYKPFQFWWNLMLPAKRGLPVQVQQWLNPPT